MADININLQKTRNSIATANNINLELNKNQFYIVAGEQNATTFEIKYDTTYWAGYSFYVEMVNALGYGIAESLLENNSDKRWITSATTFVLPEGMAVAGYGYISIKAKKNDTTVVFMPVKIPVSNTIPNWRESITDAMGAEIDANGHLIVRYDDGLVEDLGKVVGNGIASISKTGTSGLVDTYTITYTDGNTTTFTVTNGDQGQQGIQGEQGIQGKSFNPRGEWVSGNSYVNNTTTIDVVQYGYGAYYCKVSNSSTTDPETDTTNWGLLVNSGFIENKSYETEHAITCMKLDDNVVTSSIKWSYVSNNITGATVYGQNLKTSTAVPSYSSTWANNKTWNSTYADRAIPMMGGHRYIIKMQGSGLDEWAIQFRYYFNATKQPLEIRDPSALFIFTSRNLELDEPSGSYKMTQTVLGYDSVFAIESYLDGWMDFVVQSNSPTSDLNVQFICAEELFEETYPEYPVITSSKTIITPTEGSNFVNYKPYVTIVFNVTDYQQDHKTDLVYQKVIFDWIDGIKDYNGDPLLVTDHKVQINKAAVGLPNVDNTSDMDKPVSTLQGEAINAMGKYIDLSIDSDYKLTVTLKDANNNTLSSDMVDLPIESMVVNASYANGILTLTLQNGNVLNVDISAIISGLVPDSRTIAGIALSSDISAVDLTNALVFANTTTDIDYVMGD